MTDKAKQIKSSRSLELIDLFAGAGGMTLGFSPKFGNPFRSVWANDNNRYAVETYNANFGAHCTLGEIGAVLDAPETVIPSADVVIGGPPCQGFSLLNKDRGEDERKEMWRPFLKVVERSGAEVFVMENVPQILESLEFEAIKKEARRLGFKLAYGILRAADYGVAQRRYRAFIVGCKFADPNSVFPPKRTHESADGNVRSLFKIKGETVKNPQPWRTLRDVIRDLPPPVGTEIRNDAAPLDLHFGRNPTEISLKRYRTVSEEGMNRFDLQRLAPELTPACWIKKKSGGTDLFGRLWWDRPAFTIRTEFFKPEKGRYLHPEQHRPLTHREAARLQSFPDDFVFRGSKTEIAKQIGNAVPPQLAAKIAECVVELFSLKPPESSEPTQAEMTKKSGPRKSPGKAKNPAERPEPLPST